MHAQGTINLVDAAKRRGVSKFVLMSSLLTNGRAIGQGFNPIFLLINGFGGVLDKKHKVRDAYSRASEQAHHSCTGSTLEESRRKVAPGCQSADP